MDESCGIAVLRGSHVYANGIIGAPPSTLTLFFILVSIRLTSILFHFFSSASGRRGVRVRGVGPREERPKGARNLHGAPRVRRRRQVARRSRHPLLSRLAPRQVSATATHSKLKR